MTQAEILIEHGAKLIKICDTKPEAMSVLACMNVGTVAPHGDKWAVLD